MNNFSNVGKIKINTYPTYEKEKFTELANYELNKLHNAF